MVWYLIFLVLKLFESGKAENVLMTEVFEITIDSFMFNWTSEDFNDQYTYYPSLLNSPDLPSWISYRYSERHQAGFLYGVPPLSNQKTEIMLQIIAFNKKNYETRQNVIPIYVREKLNPSKNEIQLKIDNLNVEDMFDSERINRLKDIFKKKLWKDSDKDLYLTFLSSAVEMGARLPPNPNEGEGVVLRIGSVAPFSKKLLDLQAEVKPLEKVPVCPRDFKRTTVERYFREAGFALDWCAFHLLPENGSVLLQSTTTVEKLFSTMNGYDFLQHWTSFSRDATPIRSYLSEFSFSILLPLFLLTLLGILLSLILCFHHDGIQDEESEIFFENIFHLCTDYYYERRFKESKNEKTDEKCTNSQSGFDTGNEALSLNGFNFSPNLSIRSRSFTNSPTFPLTSDVHVRPTPPPYVRPKFKPAL